MRPPRGPIYRNLQGGPAIYHYTDDVNAELVDLDKRCAEHKFSDCLNVFCATCADICARYERLIDLAVYDVG